MIIRYRYVAMPHKICKGTLPKECDNFPELGACPRAILATGGGKVVGFLRFEITHYGRRFYAAGTWVHPKCRGIGIAAELWRRALNHTEPKSVEVRTISPGGRRLVGKVMQDADMDIVWKVTV